MNKYSLRPATAADSPAIRDLIHNTGLNPMGLDWQRFRLVVDEGGHMIGCAQIKPHQDGSNELASVAVVPEWRGRGIARALIEHLVQEYFAPGGLGQGQPLYLTCLERLGPLYERFDFQTISPSEMPPYFRRIHRLVSILVKLSHRLEGMLVMRRTA